ncbi:MAG: flagellar hook-length control protein FliK [Planctomycetes bacterium]|nr:flagellar hook-length control protein FliK [Planctomycetota bacterium]
MAFPDTAGSLLAVRVRDAAPQTGSCGAGEAQAPAGEFSALVSEYAAETAARGIAVDSRETVDPGAVSAGTGAVDETAGTGGEAAFSGPWQLLLDLLSAPAVMMPGDMDAADAVLVGQQADRTDDLSALVQADVPATQSVTARAAQLQAGSVLGRVASAVVSASGGNNRLVVRLHPPDLGTVTVKVTRAAGRVSVDVRASDGRVLAMLARGVGELRDTLKTQGIAVDRFNVTSGENRGRGGSGDRGRRRASVAFQIEFDSPEGE